MTGITVQSLTKRFGSVLAVDDLSFEVEEGTVTGFVGPNGAGKTTTLRMLLGLVGPTSGSALFGGVPYAALADPVREVGAVLEVSGFHPGRTARDSLRVLATAAGISPGRVEEVLAEVDLTQAAGRRVGGFSLGMRQRLGLAGALLGDPRVLILDEPANGLDPDGVRWLRGFLRDRADQGGTVLVSSHLLAELALAADHVVVIKDGRLVRQASVGELTSAGQGGVRVRTPMPDRLHALLRERGVDVQLTATDELLARNTTPEAVGQAVASSGIVVYEMRLERSNLEDVFLALTHEAEGSAR
jgi:ABC-2 type transport system ATP-binding protein